MKKKRKHAEIEQPQAEQSPNVAEESADNLDQEDFEQEQQPTKVEQQEKQHKQRPRHQHKHQEEHFEDGEESEQLAFNNHRRKRFKNPVFTRVSVDPSRTYRTPDSRESWGPNVKGKKFRKEKGKKKRCPNAGVRIDGSVNSIRLDI